MPESTNPTATPASNLAAAAVPPPIFILSCHRSGSTMLRYVFDTHPDIYSPPELFLGRAADALCMFLSGLESKRYRHNPNETPPAVLLRVRRTISELLAQNAAKRGKRRWCEKTPGNAEYLPLIEALFPGARHVCLYRHGLDMVQSGVQMGLVQRVPEEMLPYVVQSQGHEVTALLRYWIARTEAILRFERSHPTRCRGLRYEDLVADPAAVLAPLFSFLALAWDEEIPDRAFAIEHDGGMEDHFARSSTRIYAASVGTGRDLSLDGVPEEVLASLRSLLDELGYPAVNAPLAEQAESGPSPEWLLTTHLPGRLAASSDEAAAVVSTCFRVVVSGEGGGTWQIDPRPDRTSPLKEDDICTIEIAAGDLMRLASDRVNPMKVVVEGRVRLSGKVDPEGLDRLFRLMRVEAAREPVAQ